MKKKHSIHAAKTQLSRLVERVRREPARRFGAMRGRARVRKAFFEPLPGPAEAGPYDFPRRT